MDLGFGGSGVRVPGELKRAVSELQHVDRERQADPDFLTDEERTVLETVGADAYNRLAVGTDRIVYGFDGYVVKVARPREGPYDGMKANRKAVQQYRRADVEQRELLAPLYTHSKKMGWIAQERAVRMRGYEHELPDGFRKRLKAAGIEYEDTLLWNVGYIESLGHDALTDYGNDIF